VPSYAVSLVAALRRRPGRSLVALAFLAALAGAGVAGGRRWAADHHLQAADHDLARRDYEGALRHLDRALELRPGDTAAHFLAARTARRCKLYADADRHLATCRRLGWPADALALELTLRRAQDGDLAGIERQLQYLVELADHPDAPAILEALARGYHQTFQYGNALHALGLWLKRRPEDVQAILWRGQVYEAVPRTADALADYRRAAALAPEDDEVRWHLAQGLLRVGEADEAAGHFEHLLARRPDHPGAAVGLARCRRATGRVDEARELVDGVLAAHPEDAPALAERGELALQAGELAEAEGWLRQALAWEPHDRAAKYNLAQCLRRLGRKEQAGVLLADLDRAAADDQRLRDLTERIHRAPREPDPRAEAGAVCLRLGREREGLLWYASALQLDPRHRASREALATYYERAGNRTVAERHRRFLAGP
jgi:tetratricopeptide (TPR) repeat protein